MYSTLAMSVFWAYLGGDQGKRGLAFTLLAAVLLRQGIFATISEAIAWLKMAGPDWSSPDSSGSIPAPDKVRVQLAPRSSRGVSFGARFVCPERTGFTCRRFVGGSSPPCCTHTHARLLALTPPPTHPPTPTLSLYLSLSMPDKVRVRVKRAPSTSPPQADRNPAFTPRSRSGPRKEMVLEQAEGGEIAVPCEKPSPATWGPKSPNSPPSLSHPRPWDPNPCLTGQVDTGSISCSPPPPLLPPSLPPSLSPSLPPSLPPSPPPSPPPRPPLPSTLSHTPKPSRRPTNPRRS